MSVWSSIGSWLGENGIEALALAASGIAVGFNRRATRLPKESADYTRRTTEVAERRAVAEAARPAVRWDVSPELTQLDQTHGVGLVNVGSDTAHDLHIELPRATQTIGAYTDCRVIQPGVPLSLEVALFSTPVANVRRFEYR